LVVGSWGSLSYKISPLKYTLYPLTSTLLNLKLNENTVERY
jgi:hypothetical protein